MRKPVEDGKYNLRRERLADPAKSQRAQGYAELHSGKKIVEIVLQPANGASAGHAGVEHLLYASITDRDQRELGGDEETVRQDQHANRDALEEKETVHLAVRIAFLRSFYVFTRLGTKANRAAYEIAGPERNL
jgi:hypothetical protein